jgi:hypothetical protein
MSESFVDERRPAHVQHDHADAEARCAAGSIVVLLLASILLVAAVVYSG